ncbi:DUF6036 family nucleotidyltransferase [Kribbella sp. NPDC050124]|uniref:DUF6036 family nucleotidyltransferase n=1 Tax=Kribbella sp. NPDC050124 TaxID=3364114 RepID=UPI0037B328BB
MSDPRNEFTAAEIIDLLSELDKRLRTRGISASVFVVGGAAIAVTSGDNPRRTEDIDAITRDEAVVEEARAMASQRKLPEDWLNTRASPWMPPLPEGALQRSDTPGLHITYATDEFLLATKLIAQRRKDAGDIVALSRGLGMENASAEDLGRLIYRYYTDADSLEFIVDGKDVDREIHLPATRAERLLANHRSDLRRATPTDGGRTSAVVVTTAKPPASAANRNNQRTESVDVVRQRPPSSGSACWPGPQRLTGRAISRARTRPTPAGESVKDSARRGDRGALAEPLFGVPGFESLDFCEPQFRCEAH